MHELGETSTEVKTNDLDDVEAIVAEANAIATSDPRSEENFPGIEDPSQFPGSQNRNFESTIPSSNVEDLLAERDRILKSGTHEDVVRLQRAHITAHELLTAGINGVKPWNEVLKAISVPLNTHMKSADEANAKAAQESDRADLESKRATEAETKASDASYSAEIARLEARLAEIRAIEASNQALTDPLTGLRNSTYANTELKARISDYLIARKPTAMLFLDIDKFKDVNDTFGHKVGDDKLIETANNLRGAVRPFDTIVRIGGDEFIILLEATDLETATAVAERIRALGEVSGLNGDIQTTYSIGIATFGEEGKAPSTPEEFIDWADRAMYNSKQDRNKVSIFDESMQELPKPNGTRNE